MSIAIYRHLKLSVALPKEYRPSVLNFHANRMRPLCIDQEADGTWVATQRFTTLTSRRLLKLHHDQIWRIKNAELTITDHYLRNDRTIKRLAPRVIPPAFTTVWTENGIVAPTYQLFEDQEATSQVAIELYLHEYVPNPYDFKIVVMNFDPAKSILGRPSYMSHPVRSPREVERAMKNDRSEDAATWAKLFFP